MIDMIGYFVVFCTLACFLFQGIRHICHLSTVREAPWGTPHESLVPAASIINHPCTIANERRATLSYRGVLLSVPAQPKRFKSRALANRLFLLRGSRIRCPSTDHSGLLAPLLSIVASIPKLLAVGVPEFDTWPCTHKQWS